MDKYRPYFGQVVTDFDLNEMIQSFYSSIEYFLQDFQFFGIAVGADVTQNPVPSLSINVAGPAVVYDQNGRRIQFNTNQTIDCTSDENSQPTTVLNGANAKWLSIFIKYRGIPTDPRVDELGEQVFFKEVASYTLLVAQGPEAAAGIVARPGLRGDAVLLGDIKLTFGQTTITTTNIDLSRQQTVYRIAGTSIRARGVLDVLTQFASLISGIGPNSLIVPAISGSPNSLAQGSITASFTSLLGIVNSIRTELTGVSGSVLNVAYKNVANIFTRTQKLNRVDSGALWNLQLSIGDMIGVYSSPEAADSEGRLIITYNAQFGSGTWSRIDTGHSAFAVITGRNTMRLVGQPAGSSPATWPTWPAWVLGSTGRGNLEVNHDVSIANKLTASEVVTTSLTSASGLVTGQLGMTDLVVTEDATLFGGLEVQAGKITVAVGNVELTAGNVWAKAGTVTANDNVEATTGVLRTLSASAGDILSARDVTALAGRMRSLNGFEITGASGKFSYTSRELTVEMSLIDGQGEWNVSPTWFYEPSGGFWENQYDSFIAFPIKVSPGTVLKRILVTHEQPADIDQTGFVIRIPGQSVLQESDHAGQVTGYNTDQVVLDFGSGITIDGRHAARFLVRSHDGRGPAAVPRVKVHAIKLVIGDKGPTFLMP